MALWLTYAMLIGDDALALCSVLALSMQSSIVACRLPPRRTLASLAGGRLGWRVAHVLTPVSARFPHQERYGLAA
jgi:hypothetical protein